MNEKAPQFIPYMPAGAHVIHATINGEPGCARVFVDAAACARLNADLAELWEAARRREHARPVLYFDHKQGEAAAFPRRFVWEDERGILLEIAEWTAAGRAAVEGANYGYISPAFRLSREDGQVLGLVPGVEVGSLVNDPAFERIDPIVDNIAAAKAAPLAPGVDVVTSAHCNQHGHVPDCQDDSGGKEPIEINFHSEYKTKKEWLNAARDYFKSHYAGRKFAIGETGHTLHIGNSETRAKLATKGVDNQRRFSAFEKLEKVISIAEHLGSEEAKAKDGQGHHKADIIAKTATFEKYGAPAKINGEKCLIWFNAQTKEKGAKDVLLYEFGLGKMDDDIQSSFRPLLRQAQMVPEAAEYRGRAKLEGDTILLLLPTNQATHDSAGIINGEHSDVKSGKEAPQNLSTAEAIACAGNGADNGSAAKTGGNTTMTEETKKKLGLPDDADDAAVEAAVAELLEQVSEHKKKAETAQAEAKKKDEELKAARAAEKQAWLDELKQRGVLAPKDEAAVEAAAALFEANPAAARTAYGKMQGVATGAVITASQAGQPEEKNIEDLIQF